MFAVCMCVPMEGLDQPGWYHQSSELLGESTNNIDMQTRVSGMRCCRGMSGLMLLSKHKDWYMQSSGASLKSTEATHAILPQVLHINIYMYLYMSPRAVPDLSTCLVHISCYPRWYISLM